VKKLTNAQHFRQFEARIETLEKAHIRLHEIVHERLAKAVDKKYEFGEILECLDDIMTHLNL
jgi:hypothetical protein